MNKKFLSAILFGALMVTSTGTFVSCKDYDDDIDQINSELAGVKTQIADLQNKINAGKWITGVTTTAEGVSITLSDGQTINVTNGKDGAAGAAGEAGAPGTQWTISEDGYWVCDGEKTDVVAVGKDGEDAQAEVKFENGKWMLWNGTEYVAFEAAEELPANAVYAVTDVNDPNFVNLFYTNEAGEQVAVRMPMNEGLGQIVVLGASLDVNYHRFNGAYKKNSSNQWVETAWDGAKATPAKGEYMLTANQDVVYVQVVPANYDISKLNFKLVNTKGDEAPFVFGTPVPTTDAVSRAVSESGVYAIPYTLKDMTKAEVTAFDKNIKGKALSLVANESVRSTYTYSASLNDATADAATYGDEDHNVVVKPENLGKAVTIVPNQAERVYDSYLIMANADAKADSVRYGIKMEGMTITAYDAEKINGKTVQFAVRQLGAKAHITTATVNVTFGKEVVAVTEVVLPAVAHNAVAVYWNSNGWAINGQYIDVDFAPYFEKVAATEGERLIWNSDMSKPSINLIYDQWNEFGESVVEDGINVTSYLYNGYNYLNAAGASTYADGTLIKVKDFAKLRIWFKRDYPGIILGNGTLKAVVKFTDGDAVNHTVEIPFTIAKPSAEEIAKVYSWNATYMKEGVLTVVDEEDKTIKLTDYFQPTYYTGATLHNEGIEPKNGDQKLSVNGTEVKLTGDKNKAYELKGLKVALLGKDCVWTSATESKEVARLYSIPNLKVNFASSKANNIDITGTVSVLSGAKTVTIKDAAIAEAGELQFKLVDYAGDVLEFNEITRALNAENNPIDLPRYIANVKLVKTAVFYDEDGKAIETIKVSTQTITNKSAGTLNHVSADPTIADVDGAKTMKIGYNLVIETTEEKVAADTAQSIYIKFLNNKSGKFEEVVKSAKINVTVKAAI